MIALIDFGSQTAHLIKRRVADLGLEIKIVEPENALSFINQNPITGIILSGGPASVYAEEAPGIDQAIFKQNLPILGICYGWQLTAHKLDGKVEQGNKEYGPAVMNLNNNSPLFTDLPDKLKVWMSHSDRVTRLPSGFDYLGQTEQLKAAAVANENKQVYGLQFHPEVQHTEQGNKIIQNFLEKVCGLAVSPKKIEVKQVIAELSKELKPTKGTIIAAVSGGVDSTVASALVAKAAANRFVPIYCDNGLMRAGTKEAVAKIFKENLNVDPVIVDCKQEFLNALQGVSDPEKKRKIIGNLYIRIFEREAKKLDDVEFLVQGTIYSDVIESKGSKNASKIKSHHNVGGLPEKMELKLIEPVREFYKDEVRELGRQLNLPEEIVNRQPFPGPGHAIRILGEVTPERLAKQHQADKIVIEVLKETGWFEKVFQSFPIMTGTMTTAVKGDARAYAELVGLRIYNSKDIMTAGWTELPYDILQKISSRIVNEVLDVSRVAYDITTKPPATMEWE